jgi:uracil phosphoribosyltransferase
LFFIFFIFVGFKGLRFAAKICGVSIIPSGESMEGALRQIMPHVCVYDISE